MGVFLDSMSRIFTAAFSDSPVGMAVEKLLVMEVGDRAYVETRHFWSENELLRLLAEGPCDLVFAYLSDVRWYIDPIDQVRVRIERLIQRFHSLHPEWPLIPRRLREANGHAIRSNLLTATRALSRIHCEHQVPVISTQGMDFNKEFVGTGVWFLVAPFEVDSIREALRRVIAERLRK